MKNSVFNMTKGLKISIAGVVLEGLLSACGFPALYAVLQMIFGNEVSFLSLLVITAIVAALFILRIILYSAAYTGSQIGGADVSRRIKISIGNKLRKIPLAAFTKNKRGFYINAATNEVSSYEQVLTHKVADIIKYIILLAVVDIFICFMYLPVGIVHFIASLLVIPTLIMVSTTVKNHGTQKNSSRNDNVSYITEYITGIQTLRSYGMGGKKNESLNEAMEKYSDISYHYEKAIQPIGQIYLGVNWLAFPLSILFSVAGWQSNVLTAPMLIMLIMMPMFVCKLNGTLMISLIAYKNLMLSEKTLAKIFDEDEDKSDETEFCPVNTEIEFDNVTFSYNNTNTVLCDMSFKIDEKKLTAIVGDSGSGKSTILNLIQKFYLPQKGQVKIGGLDIGRAKPEAVLSYISSVDQDVFLFNDTVKNNIRYARADATDEEIKSACRLANCEEFILKTENGYDTQIGENGNKLSGGERQRLSVARAILKDSPIVLLDEATASLDIENELLVKQAISNLLKADKTVIMIAHTLSIVKEADKVMVIDGGKIAECGTHDELLQNGKKYAAMWSASQKLK